MSNTSALVPYLFEGHRIRVSTDQHGEAWIVVTDACAALAESPMVWAMANRRDEEHCLYSEEGPGAGGFTLALINEAALLRRLLNSENPSAPRMRRWLTHELSVASRSVGIRWWWRCCARATESRQTNRTHT
jgi:prophage antirepressor-like protein